jgi:hypothetical protein
MGRHRRDSIPSVGSFDREQKYSPYANYIGSHPAPSGGRY